ncbi:MAG: MMPL family transporter, partial [Propionibacteriaceae bacterium]|nr:MMPL family transporter [Propionibacteriaceae bacterium]
MPRPFSAAATDVDALARPDSGPAGAGAPRAVPASPSSPSPPLPPARRGWPARLAVWSARHALPVILGWLAVVVATASLAAAIAPKRVGETEMIRGEAQTATDLAIAAGMTDPIIEAVIATAADGGRLDATEATTALTDLAERLSALPEVAFAGPAPIPADDGAAFMIQVQLASASIDVALDEVAPVLAATAAVAAEHPSLKIEQAGPMSLTREANELLSQDLSRATVTSVPLTLIILLVAFGAIIMALMPVVLAVGAVAAAFGLWAVASQVFPDQGMVQHVILLMGMAVGVDYSLFYLRRFREEIHARGNKLAAIAAAADTAGHSVIISGTAVSLALATTLFLDDTFFSGMGLGAILVVLVAVGSSVTVLPALVSVLSRFIDRPRVPWLWRLTTRPQARVMPALLRPVVRHPILALSGAVVVMAVLALPAASMKLKLTGVEDLPRRLASMTVYERIIEHYPGAAGTARVVVTLPNGATSDIDATAGEFVDAIADPPDLFGTLTGFWAEPGTRTVVLDVQVLHAEDLERSRLAVETLREDILPTT